MVLACRGRRSVRFRPIPIWDLCDGSGNGRLRVFLEPDETR